MSEMQGTRVLVIDDHDDVARMIAMVLTHGGCAVEVAATADEAALIVEASPQFDLVVCDVMLPGTPGPATIERLGHPLASTIFVSGYPRASFSGTPNEIPAPASFVQKPFRPAEFLATVRGVLLDSTPGQMPAVSADE